MTPEQLYTHTANLLRSHNTNASIIRSIALMPAGYRQMPSNIRAGMIFHPDVDGVIVWSTGIVKHNGEAIAFWERGAPPPCAPYVKYRTKESVKFFEDWGLTAAKFPV